MCSLWLNNILVSTTTQREGSYKKYNVVIGWYKQNVRLNLPKRDVLKVVTLFTGISEVGCPWAPCKWLMKTEVARNVGCKRWSLSSEQNLLFRKFMTGNACLQRWVLSSGVKSSFPEGFDAGCRDVHIFVTVVCHTCHCVSKPNSQEASVSLSVRKKSSPAVASFKVHKPASSYERERLRHC